MPSFNFSSNNVTDVSNDDNTLVEFVLYINVFFCLALGIILCIKHCRESCEENSGKGKCKQHGTNEKAKSSTYTEINRETQLKTTFTCGMVVHNVTSQTYEI